MHGQKIIKAATVVSAIQEIYNYSWTICVLYL